MEREERGKEDWEIGKVREGRGRKNRTEDRWERKGRGKEEEKSIV